jgi:hypothetical protein
MKALFFQKLLGLSFGDFARFQMLGHWVRPNALH